MIIETPNPNKGEMNVDGKIHDLSKYCLHGEEAGDPGLLLCAKVQDKVDCKKLFRMFFMCLLLGFIFLVSSTS